MGAAWSANKDYNLNFLKFYKGIKALHIQLYTTTDFDPVKELASSLEHLHIGSISSKKSDIYFLKEMESLISISLVRIVRGVESIASLKSLKELSLTGYSINKLEFLNELKAIKKLYLGFGTSTDINTISKLEQLEELSIYGSKSYLILMRFRTFSKYKS